MGKKRVAVIGAGPAGLTAAHEILEKDPSVELIVLEADSRVGGLARTLDFPGGKLDLGGHRFFSRSREIMDFWLRICPLQGAPAIDDILLSRPLPLSGAPDAPDPEIDDLVMLVRRRLSRILFSGVFFDYPLSLGAKSLFGLGFWRSLAMALSFLKAKLLPRKEELTLEDFLVNRFGAELYETFFASYTEKVWGVPCSKIPALWGRQRIRGVSVGKLAARAFLSPFKSGGGGALLCPESAESGLIDSFLYPKYGPGQFWEELARRIESMGGRILPGREVVGIEMAEGRAVSVATLDSSGRRESFPADAVISSMPLKDLAKALGPSALPAEAAKVADGLLYRDFRVVGLLVKRMKIRNATALKTLDGLIPDTWIYVQEPHVKLGRLQVFNNWSPYMPRDFRGSVWLGLEYFCSEGDGLWSMSDEEMGSFAAAELASIGFVERDAVLDAVSVKAPKAYPAYFGSYSGMKSLQDALDAIPNLYPVGRNGTHRYNNMDHSMLSGLAAAACVVSGAGDKRRVWEINAEPEYQEGEAP